MLPINQVLHDFEAWDEESIINRSKALFKNAILIWLNPKKTSVQQVKQKGKAKVILRDFHAG